MSEELQTGRLIPYLTEMFRYQAWIAMGKMASPVSGKVERNLPTARAMIDLLAELETRTEGNRSSEESKLLLGVLTDLRINFLDEQKKPDEPEPAAKEGEPGGEDEAQAGPTGGPGPDEPESEPETEAPPKEAETE